MNSGQSSSEELMSQLLSQLLSQLSDSLDELKREIRIELKDEIKREIQLYFRDGAMDRRDTSTFNNTTASSKVGNGNGILVPIASTDDGSTNAGRMNIRMMGDIEQAQSNHIRPSLAETDTTCTHNIMSLGWEQKSDDPYNIDILKEDVCTLKRQMHDLLAMESSPISIPHGPRISLTFNGRKSGRVLFMPNPPGNDQENSTSGETLCLDDDTFSLMMISKPFSPSWALGLTAFVFQAVLGVMIAEEQLRAGAESSTLEIPFKVDYVVRLGQLLTIILCLATQDDVLTSVQTFLNLGKKSNWDTVVGIEGNRSRSLWMTRVFFPTMLKLTQGIIVILVCFVIILQSSDIIDLLKDFTALMVLSDTDNIFFGLADYGYLGRTLKDKTAEVRSAEIKEITTIPECDIAENTKDSRSSRRRFNFRSYVLFLMFIPLIVCWLIVVWKQLDGTFFRQMYPFCNTTSNAFELALDHFGDGQCYGGPLNTLGCGFEGGDCIAFNLAFPLCKADNFIDVQEKIGNGVCDPEFGVYECRYDGYDCCPYEIVQDKSFGNGVCNGGKMSTIGCAYDSGDCDDFRERYPDCNLEELSKISGSENVILGDGFCDGGIYDIESCGWESGDCPKGQIGQDIAVDDVIAPSQEFYQFEQKLSLDGSKLMVSSFFSDNVQNVSPGFVQIYQFNPRKRVWVKYGDEIVGTQEREHFGLAIAMNYDGTRLAVGAPNNDNGKGVNDDFGCVRVFDFDGEGKVWLQIGEIIKGSKIRDYVGYNLDMTASGSRLAIFASGGLETLYDGELSIWEIHQSDQWIPVGQKIYGKSAFELIGSLSLHLSSSDGSRIIFNVANTTRPINYRTRIYGYDLDANEWIQLGQDFPTPYSQNKDASKISADGSRIAIASNAQILNATGQVQIFDYDSTKNKWDQVGETIFQPTKPDSFQASGKASIKGNGFGLSIALSSDGNHLAIAMVNPHCGGDLSVPSTKCDTGLVYLYGYDSTTRKFWRIPDKEPFSPITETGTIEARPQKRNSMVFGFHLSFNADASRLSISSYDLSTDQGIINVYDLNELFYLNCMVHTPFDIGNGECADLDPFNSEECGYDGGDCPQPISVDRYPECFVAYPERVGDGDCYIYPPYNSEACGYDGGDCPKPVPIEDYPGCVVIPEVLGNGWCDKYWPYNTEECGWDGGDCI